MAASDTPVVRAVRWIDAELAEDPGRDRLALVDEAARRFDLSPLDQDFLWRELAARRRPAP